MLSVYLGRPISGCTYDEVADYYNDTASVLRGWGFEVLHAMTGKSYLRNEIAFKAKGYKEPASTNRAIVGRDRWMVKTADIFYANLIGSKIVSMGTVAELAWAYDNGKHVILAMEEDNIHQHAFVIEAADIIYPIHEDAFNYFRLLSQGEV